jgi:hypothetical protein
VSNQVNAGKPAASVTDDAPCSEPRHAGAVRERPAVVAYFNAEHSRNEAGGDESRLDIASGDAMMDCVATAGGDCIYPDDIDDWAERFEVTPEQLRAAMRRVGARADDVARYLGNPDVV